jgi:hypothetical protein
MKQTIFITALFIARLSSVLFSFEYPLSTEGTYVAYRNTRNTHSIEKIKN